MSSVELWSGLHLLGTGELAEAGESLGHAMRLQEPWGSAPTATSWARGLLAYHAALTGDGAGARAVLGDAPAAGEESDELNLWRRTHAELLLAPTARAEEALAVAELSWGALPALPHVLHPDWKPWQSLKARAPSAAWQPRPRGSSHAWALAALGAASFAAARQVTEAREPLRQALELAEACGCPPLIETVRSELYATGARPRTAALSGVGALTASEHRGPPWPPGAGPTARSRRPCVTPKTVELHLPNAYRKLGIRSRRELPSALSGA